jgi:hypothetical protein
MARIVIVSTGLFSLFLFKHSYQCISQSIPPRQSDIEQYQEESYPIGKQIEETE